MFVKFTLYQVPDEWIQKALYLDLPFDNVKRTHYQHQGYEFSKFDDFNIKELLYNVLKYSLKLFNLNVKQPDLDTVFYNAEHEH